jgi:hypothetical protein
LIQIHNNSDSLSSDYEEVILTNYSDPTELNNLNIVIETVQEPLEEYENEIVLTKNDYEDIVQSELELTEEISSNEIDECINETELTQDDSNNTNDLKTEIKEEPIVVNSVELYKKMDINELRILVSQKGVISDTKKMKRNELIRILTE